VQGKAGVMTVCVWPVKSGAVVVIVDPSVQCVFDAPVPKRSSSVVQVTSASAGLLIEAAAIKIIKSFLMSSFDPVTIGMVTHARHRRKTSKASARRSNRGATSGSIAKKLAPSKKILGNLHIEA
jgi:hypothetical protein